MINFQSHSEVSDLNSRCFKTIVKARTNEELFNLVKRAITMKPKCIIITPRVDMSQKAYYWIGVRFEDRELDFKLGVNDAIQLFLYDYLLDVPIENIPEVTNFEADTIDDPETWLALHKETHMMNICKQEDIIDMTDGVNYLKTKFTYLNGKVIYPAIRVDDILSLVKTA